MYFRYICSMNETLQIIAVIVSVAALVACYIPHVPAAPIALAALVAAYFAAPHGFITIDIIIFWAVATAIIMGLRFLQPHALPAMRAGSAYIATGTIAGASIGLAISASSAAVILGSVIGAFLALTAYMRTPASPKLPVASSPFIQYYCAKSFPIIIAVSMSAISLASVLL